MNQLEIDNLIKAKDILNRLLRSILTVRLDMLYGHHHYALSLESHTIIKEGEDFLELYPPFPGKLLK